MHFLPVMSRLRFVKTPTEEIIEQLREIYHGHSDFAFRKRAHAILLSDKGTTINQLQDIFEVDRDTISAWIKRFETSGVEGLKSLPIPGRPPIYTDDEVRQLSQLLRHQCECVLAHRRPGLCPHLSALLVDRRGS